VIDTTHLPGAVRHAWDWQSQAACREADTAIFFHPTGERGTRFEEREKAAKQVCARCPVLMACRRYALQAQEAYGVWGGLTEAERLARTGRQRRRSSLAS